MFNFLYKASRKFKKLRWIYIFLFLICANFMYTLVVGKYLLNYWSFAKLLWTLRVPLTHMGFYMDIQHPHDSSMWPCRDIQFICKKVFCFAKCYPNQVQSWSKIYGNDFKFLLKEIQNVLYWFYSTRSLIVLKYIEISMHRLGRNRKIGTINMANDSCDKR